ncbi:MAG: hypothetical protein LBG46_00390 [Elusimicrobiota bacterium]|nr:hypothetical protein [Elusimicrobiota bacterium]
MRKKIQSIEEKIKVSKGLDKYVTKHAEVEKLKALSAENRVSEILKSSNTRETAKLYFDEVGIEEFPEMIAKAHKLAELKTNGMLPAKFLAEAFAKSLLGKPADTDAILNKAVEKYPSAQRAAKKEFFIKQLKEGKIPKEVSETLFPKATQEAIQLRLWDKIETDFKGGKGGLLGIAMLGFIIGMELISGKASANNAGLDTRLAIGELIGGSPELAGIYCATEPKIMTDIIKGYAGNKEQLEAGLTNYFNNLIDLLKSKDIMNEPVAKDAMAERKRQQEQALKKALNNNKKKSNNTLNTLGSNGFLGGHLRF